VTRLRGVLWPLAALMLAALLVTWLGPAGPESAGTDVPGDADTPAPAERAVQVDIKAGGRVSAGNGDEAPPETGTWPCSGEPPELASDVVDRAYRARLADGLERSADAEHLLVAALLTDDDPERQRRNFAAALRTDADNALILWNALHHCSSRRDPAAAFCGGDSLRERALAVDGDNGAVWLRIAAYRSADGDVEGSLDALQRATSAPGFDNYWFEHIQLFDRALAAAGERDEAQRLLHAIGMAAAIVGDEFMIAGICPDMSESRVDWRYACLRAAERIERDSGTMMGRLVGIALQETLYELDGDEDARAAAAERESALKQAIDERVTPDALTVFYRDARVQHDYLDVGEADGEFAALEFVRSEAERLAALPGYDPCRPGE